MGQWERGSMGERGRENGRREKDRVGEEKRREREKDRVIEVRERMEEERKTE